MIAMDDALFEGKYGCQDCKLLLQVHDELVYEVPIEHVAGMKVLMKKCMEGALQLLVPITIQM